MEFKYDDFDDFVLNFEGKINMDICQHILINKICEYISSVKDERIKLLRIPEVVMWLFGELCFLKLRNTGKQGDIKKYNKTLEDEWGINILKLHSPKLKLNTQWTNTFGESICAEMCYLQGEYVLKQPKIGNLRPDIEISDSVIECKTQTYCTSGTAGEKILGCPFKYAKIPRLFKKKLIILSIGGAEKRCREEYGNLPGEKCHIEEQEFIDFYKSKQIEFRSATDILVSLICN